jgi:hypothetical protein
VLFALKANLASILAIHHPNTKADIISYADLIHQPSEAMRIVRFMACHGFARTTKVAGHGYCLR